MLTHEQYTTRSEHCDYTDGVSIRARVAIITADLLAHHTPHGTTDERMRLAGRAIQIADDIIDTVGEDVPLPRIADALRAAL